MDILSELNDKQLEAVKCTEGPLLVLAGAGSGKTKAITMRIAYLIGEMGVDPYNILAITFTNKAAGEMRERVEAAMAGASLKGTVWVATFHATCVRILRRYIDRLGYPTDFTIYDGDDQKSLMKNVCKTLNIDTKVHKERSLLNKISALKDELVSPEDYALEAEGNYNEERVAKVYTEYQAQLRKNGALDFDDLIVKTVELFRTNPDVLQSYQERFKYIMVDEYQDTNTAQFQLVALLADKYKNLCVVGDDDQSIYKFRGANIENILSFEHKFEGARVIKLEQNYRSTKNILTAANSVIANNYGRKEKSLWTENEEGERIHFDMLDNAYEEAQHVAHKITMHKLSGGAYSDCAILYRTNAQSRVLEEKLIQAGIPYKLVGGVNFYQRKEIKDMLAYLKVIESGRDDLALRRIINVPKRAIGQTTVDKVAAFASAEGIGMFEAMIRIGEEGAMGKTGEKLRGFVDLIKGFREKLGDMPASKLLIEVMETTGYLKELKDENTDESKDRINNLDELISNLANYELNAEEPTLTGFLEEVALVADVDSYDENSDYVVLLTIHASKGLEFKNVYLCGMEDGLFPGMGAILDDDEQEEERRLCYVAMTRAKKSLYLSAARMRMLRGEMQYNNISRFVKEIEVSVMDEKEAKVVGETEHKSTIMKPSQSSNAKAVFTTKSFNAGPVQVSKADSLEYSVGDTVKHIKFGVGNVLEITDGGKDFEVTVEFEKAGVKKMFASFAKLKKM